MQYFFHFPATHSVFKERKGNIWMVLIGLCDVEFGCDINDEQLRLHWQNRRIPTLIVLGLEQEI